MGVFEFDTRFQSREIIIYEVGHEPPEWKGHTVVGWIPSEHNPPSVFGHGQWDAVIWSARHRCWSPGNDIDGKLRATYVFRMGKP